MTGCQERWSKIVHWPIYCTCKLPPHADCWDASRSIYSTGCPRGFARDVLHEFLSNIFYKAHCVKCMPYGSQCHDLSCIHPHAACEPRRAAPPGNKRAAAPIHVSAVTRMEWQGIAAATSAASSPHALAGAVSAPGSEKACSFEGCCYSGRLLVLHGDDYAQCQ